MDIMRRGPMNGIQIAETLRAQYPCPIIYLTGNSDQARAARLTGSFGLLVKPIVKRNCIPPSRRHCTPMEGHLRGLSKSIPKVTKINIVHQARHTLREHQAPRCAKAVPDDVIKLFRCTYKSPRQIQLTIGPYRMKVCYLRLCRARLPSVI